MFQARPWVDVIRERNCCRQNQLSVHCVPPPLFFSLPRHGIIITFSRLTLPLRRGRLLREHREDIVGDLPGLFIGGGLPRHSGLLPCSRPTSSTGSVDTFSAPALALQHPFVSSQVQQVLHEPDSTGLFEGIAGIQSHMVLIRHSVSAQLGFKSPTIYRQLMRQFGEGLNLMIYNRPIRESQDSERHICDMSHSRARHPGGRWTMDSRKKPLDRHQIDNAP